MSDEEVYLRMWQVHSERATRYVALQAYGSVGILVVDGQLIIAYSGGPAVLVAVLLAVAAFAGISWVNGTQYRRNLNSYAAGEALDRIDRGESASGVGSFVQGLTSVYPSKLSEKRPNQYQPSLVSPWLWLHSGVALLALVYFFVALAHLD